MQGNSIKYKKNRRSPIIRRVNGQVKFRLLTDTQSKRFHVKFAAATYVSDHDINGWPKWPH